MKNIIITSLDINLMGGIERTNSSLYELFTSKGHKVTLLSFFKTSRKPFFDFPESSIFYLNNTPFKSNYFYKFLTIIMFFKLLIYLWKRKDDYIVISNFPRTSILFSMFFWKKNRVIAHEHSSFNEHNSIISWLRLKLYKRLRCTVVLTNHDKKIFQSHGVKVFKIPNFSKFKNYNNQKIFDSSKAFNCLSAGRLHDHKGFDRLLLIIKELQKENIVFNIVGSGPQEKYISDLIIEYKLGNIVNLIPASNNLDKHIENCDLYLMTSRTEAAPLVLLEALAYSKPIVAYDCPIGVREIVSDGENGFLVKDGDIDEYVKKVKEILHSSETYNHLSLGASAYSQKHSPDSNYLLWSEHI